MTLVAPPRASATGVALSRCVNASPDGKSIPRMTPTAAAQAPHQTTRTPKGDCRVACASGRTTAHGIATSTIVAVSAARVTARRDRTTRDESALPMPVATSSPASTTISAYVGCPSTTCIRCTSATSDNMNPAPSDAKYAVAARPGSGGSRSRAARSSVGPSSTMATSVLAIAASISSMAAATLPASIPFLSP